MNLSDTELIKQIRGGNKDYYRYIVDRYKDRAYMLAVQILRNREDAEEAVQDAFVRAYNALDKFEGLAKFGTWFYKILYNVCLTRVGKRKDEYESVNYDDGEEYSAFDSFVSYDMPDYEREDLISFIKNTIESLPTKYRTVLSLFYFQDLSHEEVCEVTQLPLGTVKTQLFRARNLLQEKLQKEFAMENVI
jgi:RNA polymerase sigma-70 factor, ECF subfamily